MGRRAELTSEALSLGECAARLGVHYMTVYRYVRTGMLPARKVGAEWRVDGPDLAAFATAPRPVRSKIPAPGADRLEARLVAGDERGAWRVIEAGLAAGMTPTRVYVDMIGAAMRNIGDGWAEGSRTIADEHRASAAAHRLMGRMAGRFAAPGRPKGRVVVGAPAGERHELPVTMVADMLRGAGFGVIDVGTDLPTGDYVAAARQAAPLTAVGISASSSKALGGVRVLIKALRVEGLGPILLGGGAVLGGEHARSLGADLYAGSGPEAVAVLSSL